MSDLLVCPRCGPEWGLVMVPEAVRERRVITGSLGCPNCRRRFGIRGGVAELAVGSAPEAGGAWGGEDGAVRIAALLGLGERRRGIVLLAGPATAHAPGLLRLFEGVELVVGESPGTAGSASHPEVGTDASSPGISRIELGETLPVRTGALSGVVLTGGAAALAEEGARVLGPGARILVDPSDEVARGALAGAGLRLLAEDGRAVLAAR